MVVIPRMPSRFTTAFSNDVCVRLATEPSKLLPRELATHLIALHFNLPLRASATLGTDHKTKAQQKTHCQQLNKASQPASACQQLQPTCVLTTFTAATALATASRSRSMSLPELFTTCLFCRDPAESNQSFDASRHCRAAPPICRSSISSRRTV